MNDPTTHWQRTALLLSEAIYSPVNKHFDEIVDRDGLVVGVHAPGDSDVAWVVFRGSDDALDWQRNFDTAAVGNTHRGFQEAAHTLEVSVRNLVNDHCRGKRLVFCGHSLGGALAEVSARLAVTYTSGDQRRINAVITIMTFGAPRTRKGEKMPVAWIEHHRFVTEGDPVPHVPLWLMGYRHTTMPRVLTPNGLKARFGVLGRLRTLFAFGRWGRRAHSIKNYITLFNQANPL